MTPDAPCAKPVKVEDESQVDAGMRLRHRERLLDDLDALALQDVGKPRVVLEVDVIEGRDQLVVGAVPVMEHRRDDAARLEPPVEADAVEHLQRGGMVGAGPRHLLEEIVLAQRLDKRDRNVLLRQCERQAQTDRSGAHDDDTILKHGTSLTVVANRTGDATAHGLATTSFMAPAQP